MKEEFVDKEDKVIDLLLKEIVGEKKSINVREQVLSKIKKKKAKKALLFYLSAAAAIFVFTLILNQKIPLFQSPVATAGPVAEWLAIPNSDTHYEVIAPNHFKLLKGELRLKSDQKASVTIETSNSLLTADKGEFLVSCTPKTSPSLNTTKMLVLNGLVSLSAADEKITFKKNEAAFVKDKQVKKIVLTVNNDFAFNLYKEINKSNNKNLFYSPYSMINAFAILAEGARGKTAEEIGKTLSLPADLLRKEKHAQNIPWEIIKIHTGISKMNQLLSNDPNSGQIQKVRSQIAGKLKNVQKLERKQREQLEDKLAKIERELKTYQFSIINQLWVEKSSKLNKNYLDKIAKVYDAPIKKVDFANDWKNVRSQINKQVSEATNQTINDLIPPEALDENSRLVIANALHFKGDWLKSFDKKYTEKQSFHAFDKEVQVDMMREFYSQTVKYGIFNSNGDSLEIARFSDDNKTESVPPGGFEILEMPYKGNDISMVFLLPSKANEIESIESKLNSVNLSKWLKTLVQRKTSIYIPKFKSESSINDFPGILKNMGIKQAFTEDADFSGISHNENLFISNVFHKAFIEVNESGSEAAAATAFSASKLEENIPFYPSFKANRSFIYLIRDMNSGAVLFVGRMIDPTK